MNIGKWTAGIDWGRVPLLKTVLCQKGGTLPLREKSQYSRPGRPDPITLFKALYLRNRMSDRQAVFFDEYHLDVKVVWHGYYIASVPVIARGACQTWGTLGDPQNTLSQ